MNTIFKNASAAQRAIPELRFDWSDARLKALGESVKSLYPELAAWGPHLAGEAHLFFVSRRGQQDGLREDHPGTVRNAEFLPFLIERLEHTQARHVDSENTGRLGIAP